MEITLKHTAHGQMIVHHKSEIERLAKWGWVVVVEPTVYNDSTAQPAKADSADSPPAKTEKRRGRPPKGA